MYARAKIGGFLHLSIGEEATIVGSARALRESDYLVSTYRSHGHALARGTRPRSDGRAVRARRRLLRRARRLDAHVRPRSGASWAATGSSAATCRSPPGSRLASDYTGTDDVTLCTFGDGASNQGTFGETLNLAALWRLPVVFVVTNNQFGMGTSLERHSAVTDLQRKGESLGVPGPRCDGMDVLDTHASSARLSSACARSAARCSSRPSPTASAAIRWPTPRSTAPRRRSRTGASATRSPRSARCSTRGGPRRGGQARSSTARRSPGRRGGRVRGGLAVPAAESLYEDVYVLDERCAAGTRSGPARRAAELGQTPARSPSAIAPRSREAPRGGLPLMT